MDRNFPNLLNALSALRKSGPEAARAVRGLVNKSIVALRASSASSGNAEGAIRSAVYRRANADIFERNARLDSVKHALRKLKQDLKGAAPSPEAHISEFQAADLTAERLELLQRNKRALLSAKRIRRVKQSSRKNIGSCQEAQNLAGNIAAAILARPSEAEAAQGPLREPN